MITMSEAFFLRGPEDSQWLFRACQLDSLLHFLVACTEIFSSFPWFPREIHRVVRPSLDTVEQHFTVTPITSAVGHVHGSDIPSYPISRYLLHVLYILPVEGQVALNISLPDS